MTTYRLGSGSTQNSNAARLDKLLRRIGGEVRTALRLRILRFSLGVPFRAAALVSRSFMSSLRPTQCISHANTE